MKNPVFTSLVGAVLLALSVPSQADFVIEDQLEQAHNPSGEVLWRTVDFIEFSTAGGPLTFDVFSSNWFENHEFRGIPDPSVWLFRWSDVLDMSNLIGESDDSWDETTDPPTDSRDPHFVTDLSPGQYVVAVGSSGGPTENILTGLQFVGVNSGPVYNTDPALYRLTVTGAARLLQTVPEPSSLALLGISLVGLMRSRRRH